MSTPQPLSSKEQSLFRQVVKNYESKQYKKGLKTADQILRKSPNNGDTQAMKALLINSLGQSDEAFALAKVALKNGMKSHTCWHVYGLLWRSHRNWEEAIKAYRFALRLDPDNQTIQRDLALMQVQMRDYQGYLQSRKQMLQARPAARQNWTATAVAHHLAGELDEAEKLLTTFEDTLKNPPAKNDIEHSEALLYKNVIIAERGDVERALEHLRGVQASVLDRVAAMEMEAEYLLRLGRLEEAEKAYRTLLARNNEYRAYYEGLEKAMGLEPSDKQGRKEMYSSYAEKFDRLDAARRIPLDFLEGSDFQAAADHYLRRMLEKGVPSTFNNIKAVYVEPAKRKIVQDLVEEYAQAKQTNGSNGGDSGSEVNGKHSDQFQEAALYFLAQHYSYKLTRDLKRALELTEQLIEAHPKTYDYVMTKARILKHKGNPAEAARLMNAAREIDPRDRYINTKCAKYQLRNHEHESALTTMSKFTKNDVVGGTLGDLHEMQSLWFLTEDGEAHWRQGNLGRALKRFHSIYDIFAVWEEDQFDFHSFSFRKGQVRAYLQMIRWEDKLRDHPFFARVAVDAVRLYLYLYDNPEAAQGDGLPYDFATLDTAERKNALKAAKKEYDRVEKASVERKDADKKVVGKKGNVGLDGEVKKSDDDPHGTKLAQTKEPLEVAMKFLGPLLEYGKNNLQAQLVGFEVYLRRGKYLLALKCFLSAYALSADHPTLHQQAIRLRQAITQSTSPSTPAIVDLVNKTLPMPYSDASKPLAEINNYFFEAHPNSAQHLFAFVRAQHALDPSSNKSAVDVVGRGVGDDRNFSIRDALDGIQLLKDLKFARDDLNAFVRKAVARLPEAEVLIVREAGLSQAA